MEITELTIRIIILLLPGIFGTFFIEKLCYKERLELKNFIISTILIGFISYFLLFLLKNAIEIIKTGLDDYHYIRVKFFDSLVGKEESIYFMEVVYASIIGILFGIFTTYTINKGWFYNFFRDKLHITNSTGQEVWAELFDNNTKGIKSHVYVIDDKNDKVYGGWVSNFSKNSDKPELLLENVVVNCNSDRTQYLYELDKVYIKLDNSKMIIEIPKKEVKKEAKHTNRKKNSK